MSKFEETVDHRKDYGTAEKQEADINEQLKDAANLSSAQLMELAQQKAVAEKAKKGSYENAANEAFTEQEKRMMDEAKTEDTAFEQKKAAESALQLKEDARLDEEKSAKAAAEVLAGLQGTKTETGSVGESTWRSKTWQEIRQAAEDAVTPEDRAKYKSEQLEAWHALKDLEGASASQLEDARQNAEHQIRMKEETVSKPLASYDIRSGVSQSSWEERQERSRQEYIEDLEGWKKRLETINEVMNKGKSKSGSVEEGAELTTEDIIEDVDGLEKMKKKSGESPDDFNERRRKIAQEIAKNMGYKNTTTIYDQISSIDYEVSKAAKKKDGSYDKLIKEIGKKREQLLSLNAYAGNF